LAGLYFIKDFIVKKIATALKKHLNIDLVCAVDKTSDKTLKLEGIEKECTFLLGKAEEKVLVKESGFTFAVDISGGQKTGFYSDQRENRKIISSYVKGLKGYDLFCYTGGFSVYLAGSNDLTCVDSSQGALDLLKENLSLNNLLAEVVCTDVYKYLNEINETDFINADPPKYIFRDRDIKNGIKKYELLYSFCLSKIRSGGYLGASSCSGLLGFDDFISVISKSAHKAGKKLQMLHSYRGGHDYPLYLSCPESSYLKFALFKVL
jgi:23S rRNA (cytosine1962-C5)-methyltransferase